MCDAATPLEPDERAVLAAEARQLLADLAGTEPAMHPIERDLVTALRERPDTSLCHGALRVLRAIHRHHYHDRPHRPHRA